MGAVRPPRRAVVARVDRRRQTVAVDAASIVLAYVVAFARAFALLS
ncbi:hypothetical protein [Nonomuraea candida]|nr:hypothetical protein [Nonomuraea candida]